MARAEHPLALVTAPFRGEGLTKLESMAKVVLDPWIDQHPLRIYAPDDLAERAKREGAEILICEADFCMGAVLELPLRAIASTRGAPSNVDVPGATSRGIPVLHAPGRNADAVAELTVGLLFAASRGLIQADRDLRAGERPQEHRAGPDGPRRPRVPTGPPPRRPSRVLAHRDAAHARGPADASRVPAIGGAAG